MSSVRPNLDSIVPLPLVGAVLVMLVALVVLKVRAARSGRSQRPSGGDSAALERSARGDFPHLPRDPADALAALKSRSGPHA